VRALLHIDVSGRKLRRASLPSYAERSFTDGHVSSEDDEDDWQGIIESAPSGGAASSLPPAESDKLNVDIVKVAHENGYILANPLTEVVFAFNSETNVLYLFPAKSLAMPAVICVHEVLKRCSAGDRCLYGVYYIKFKTRVVSMYESYLTTVLSHANAFDYDDYDVFSLEGNTLVQMQTTLDKLLTNTIPNFNSDTAGRVALCQLCPKRGDQNEVTLDHRSCPFALRGNPGDLNIDTVASVMYRHSCTRYDMFSNCCAVTESTPLCYGLFARTAVSASDRRFELLGGLHDLRRRRLPNTRGYAYALERISDRWQVHFVIVPRQMRGRQAGGEDSDED
jgi:hypothetical protein